jgi:hypothetical protein
MSTRTRKGCPSPLPEYMEREKEGINAKNKRCTVSHAALRPNPRNKMITPYRIIKALRQ